MTDDTDDSEGSERSESWEELPESVKKENVRIAANAEGDRESDEGTTEEASDGDSE